MTAGHAWAVLAVGVSAYEVCCRPGELLSHGVDRARARHPLADVAVHAAVLVTAAHLLRWLPPKVDPYTALHRLRR